MITDPTAPARELTGKAPGGMWWVAWRQHRIAMLVSLSVAAVLAGAFVIFGLTFRSALAAANLTPQLCEDQWGSAHGACPSAWARANGYGAGWATLRVPMLFVPVLVGVLMGASAVGVDRERGTQVFALTQSVGRTRWYLTKCLVVGGPPVLAMLIVGLLGRWAGDAGGLVFSWMEIPDFQTVGIIPAAFALLAFGLAVPAGVFLRSTIAAVALSFTVAAVLVVGIGYTFYTDLVPHDRIVYAADRTGWVPMPDGALHLADGFVGADGQERVGEGPVLLTLRAGYGSGGSPGPRPGRCALAAMSGPCRRRRPVHRLSRSRTRRAIDAGGRRDLCHRRRGGSDVGLGAGAPSGALT